MTVEIGPQRADENAAVTAVHRAAFGGDYEAGVVAALREGGWAIASLVARAEGRVVGHVMFSELGLTIDGRAVAAAALAPLAVDVNWRRGGAGAGLVEAGLAAARAHGSAAVLVHGDPAYYGRFGFSAAAIGHVTTPYRPGVLLGLALQQGAFDGVAGAVTYPPPFRKPAA